MNRWPCYFLPFATERTLTHISPSLWRQRWLHGTSAELTHAAPPPLQPHSKASLLLNPQPLPVDACNFLKRNSAFLSQSILFFFNFFWEGEGGGWIPLYARICSVAARVEIITRVMGETLRNASNNAPKEWQHFLFPCGLISIIFFTNSPLLDMQTLWFE